MSQLALYLLGPPRVERGGESVKIAGRKAVALLAYLVVAGRGQAGRSRSADAPASVHSRDALATLLWPESDQSHARAELRRALSSLRRTLGEGWLEADRETVGLRQAQRAGPGWLLWLDIDEFRQRLAGCETHGHAAEEVCADCVPLLEAAAALYRDDFMAGFTLRDSLAFDEWQFFQAEGLRQELASALERLVRWHSDQEAYEAGIPYARRWLAQDPLHEPVHRQLMGLYAGAGQRAAALRQYRACVRILEQELGLPPSDETTALYERIRAEREVVRFAPARAPRIPPTSPPGFLDDSEPEVIEERPVFVTRERELASLRRNLDQAIAGRGNVAFIIGGPGRGKTALMAEFARRAMASHPDLLVALGGCNAYTGVGDPFLPFREIMDTLTADVETRWAAGGITTEHARRLWSALPTTAQMLLDRGPHLIDALVSGPALLRRARAAASDHPDWLGGLEDWVAREKGEYSSLEQSALFQQFTNTLCALAELHPLVLTLDDLQWVDAGSTGLLFHLGRGIADTGGRILIVGAYRPEEIVTPRDGQSHPLEKALTEFQRQLGNIWIDLSEGGETQGRRFVETLLDSEPNRLGKGFREELTRRTGGHPLFTVELLRAMQKRGDLVRDSDGRWVEGQALDWETLPARVEAVIKARVDPLDEELRDILTVASVEGERFTAQVVAQVQGIPEREVLRALSRELGVRHRLVREGEEAQVGKRFLSRYQFAHALFQGYLRDSLSAGERRLLHGEIGAALEGLYADQAQEVAVQLAHHYAAAGYREKTIEHSLRAGNQARVAYANEEALAHFQRALGLLEEPPAERLKEWRLEALEALGQTYYAVGDLAEAETHLREAIALGRRMGLAPRELVRLYYWLGRTLWWLGRYDDQLRIGEEGLSVLADAPDAVESVEAVLMNDVIALAHHAQRIPDKYREFAHQTAQLLRRLPYTPELRAAYGHIFEVYAFHDRDTAEAMEWLQLFENRAAAHHDLMALAAASNYAGMLLAEMGDHHAAITRQQRGLELFTRIGDAKHQLYCLNMAWQFLLLGDIQKAEAYASRWLETSKAVGHTGDIALAYRCAGYVSLCQAAWGKVVDAFQKALQLYQANRMPTPEKGMADPIGYWFVYQLARRTSWLNEMWAISDLGEAYLAQGDDVEATRCFQEAIALAGGGASGVHPVRDLLIASAVCGLETAQDDPAAFRAFCRRFQEQHPVEEPTFVQWYLEPAAPRDFAERLLHEAFVDPVSSDWVWEDPLGDCTFRVGSRTEPSTPGSANAAGAGTGQDGLQIHAANGRDLFALNLSAPRLLRPASGDLAVHTVCSPVSGDQIAIGGLLLWKDKENYLRLDRGIRGAHEASFDGCVQDRYVIIGRGRMPFDVSGNVFLRLERVGGRVHALCSADDEHWFTVGHAAFPVEDPVQVGLFAIGYINPGKYLGAYPDGTAIRFESFTLWGMER